MSAINIRLTGVKALVVIVLLGSFGAFRLVSARDALDTQGRAAVQEYVTHELYRGTLANGALAPEAQAQALLEVPDIRVLDIRAHGPRDDIVVRVELAPDPALPPGAALVRYYRMEYGAVMGWRVRREADRVAYWLAAF